MGVIGIFDSGVGGLSIATSIHHRLPQWPLVYASDNANYPYGTKEEADVARLTVDFVRRLARSYPLEILVIACNTASTIALPKVREALSIPIVGVVPAIKPAAQLSRNHKIGLLATPGTVARPYTDALIKQYAGDDQVFKLGTRLLVDMAEEKLRGRPIDLQRLHDELGPLIDAGVDTVVLGCTHFPLLKDELCQLLPQICWVDSGAAIAERCHHLLVDLEPNAAFSSRAVFSRCDADLTTLRAGLAPFGIETLEELPS